MLRLRQIRGSTLAGTLKTETRTRNPLPNDSGDGRNEQGSEISAAMIRKAGNTDRPRTSLWLAGKSASDGDVLTGSGRKNDRGKRK